MKTLPISNKNSESAADLTEGDIMTSLDSSAH